MDREMEKREREREGRGILFASNYGRPQTFSIKPFKPFCKLHPVLSASEGVTFNLSLGN